MSFFDKLAEVEARYQELEVQLADPDVLAKQNAFQKLAKERAEIEDLVETYRRLKQVLRELEDNAPLLRESDAEMRAMAREEEQRLLAQRTEIEERLKILLLPKDPNDDKNIVLEIRAGTGGEEASLFAADLFRMYSRYAERKRWRVEILNLSESSAGGIKEAVALITAAAGGKVFSELKYESGVHRVQRVPETEAQGRIHTSAATVAVLAEAEEVDVRIEDKDLRIEVMRSGGPGGQSVNTTDSAVQIMHIPTGIIVRCQQEKSQHKNRATAMRILRSKLLEIEREKQETAERDARRAQVKSGDRSEKIRTYNFPQDRITDHRIGLTKHNLPKVMDGDIQEIIDALRTHYQAESLRGESAN
ncbi:MAG TPA: peptide chain release factor 1 [Pseudomonadota bacterium]|nr:peptide chain release factor 1 [Pseudomonadota bacterium]